MQSKKINDRPGVPGWKGLTKNKGSKLSEHMSAISKRGHRMRRKAMLAAKKANLSLDE